MIFEDVLRALVISTNLTGSRVFLMRAPQRPAEQLITPYMVFTNVGPSPLHTMRGPLDVIEREYQFAIYDSSQSLVLGLADALRGRLDGWRGDYMGIRFGAIFYAAQTSAFEFDTKLFAAIISFRILFRYLEILPATQTRNQRQYQRQFPRSNQS
jgi:hypothetical protein